MCSIFQEIPRGEQYPCLEAKRPEHKTKNRYTTIFPCNSLFVTDKGPQSIQFKTSLKLVCFLTVNLSSILQDFLTVDVNL